MPLYIVDYIGTGKPEDHYRPRGSDNPDWSAISLGDRALLWLPIADSSLGAVKLGEDKSESLVLSSRNRIESALGIVTDSGATTLQALVASLLVSPPNNKWNRLLPTHNRFEIWLGGIRWLDQPVISGGTSYTTDFAGSENPLSESFKWDGASGFWNRHQKITGQASNTVFNSTNGSRLVGPALHPDHFAQLHLGTYGPPGSTIGMGPNVRMSPTTGEGYTFWAEDFGTAQFELFRMDTTAGGHNLYAPYVVSPVAGDLLEVRVVGSTLTAYLNGVLRAGPVTDTTLSTGQPGFTSYEFDGSSVDIAATDWLGSDEIITYVLMGAIAL